MELLVVGGGAAGVATAYMAARMGYGDRVAVLEQRYLGYGSMTRNGGRFRVHFFSRENTLFAIESAKRLLEVPRVTGVNPVIVRGGYLWLFSREESLKAFRRANTEIWGPLGVPVEILPVSEVAEKYPVLNLQGFLAAAYGRQNGSYHHDYLMLAMATYAARHGVSFVENARVRRIVVSGGRVRGVEVEGVGVVEAENVVVAAGAWSKELLSTANVDVPLTPYRKSLLVTEPYRYTLKPLVILFEEGSYLGQTPKGEIMASRRVKDPVTTDMSGVSLLWLSETAKLLATMLKGGHMLRIMRVWSGIYNTTPDHSHLLGRDPEWPEGLYVNTGYSGHGVMMAPYAGELLVKLVFENREHEHLRLFSPTRFKEGKPIKEQLVIG
ncbi:MAG: FAD-dependent oxidoreductase [Thermoproteota archaeon]